MLIVDFLLSIWLLWPLHLPKQECFPIWGIFSRLLVARRLSFQFLRVAEDLRRLCRSWQTCATLWHGMDLLELHMNVVSREQLEAWRPWQRCLLPMTRHPSWHLIRACNLTAWKSPGTPRLLAWQPWHLETSTFVSRGRRGTLWHLPSLCVAGVALRDMDCYFAWQAWHLWHWAGSGGALGFRRGAGDAAAVGVAGVALRDIYLHFVWQAWHLWHWAGSGGAFGFRRGAGDAAAVGVAAVALGDIHLRFTWQAWHFVTSTLSSHHLSSHYLSTRNLSSHYLSTHNLSTCHHTTCVFTLLIHTQLTHTQLVIRPLLITPLVITPLVFTLLVFTLLVHRAPAHRQSQAASVSAVCAAASSVAVVTVSALWHVSCGTEVSHVMNSDSSERIRVRIGLQHQETKHATSCTFYC